MRNLYDIATEVINGKVGNLTYNIYCPIIECPDTRACHTINNFSRHACGEFVRLANELAGTACEEKSVARCYQLMYSSRFLISYKYEMNVFDEKSRPYTVVSGAVWNTANGSAVEPGEFFRGNVRYKEMILYVLSAKIREKIAAGERLYPDWHNRLYAAWRNMGYYLCREGFVFLLPENTLKAEETRTAELLVPFAEVKNQLGGRLLT